MHDRLNEWLLAAMLAIETYRGAKDVIEHIRLRRAALKKGRVWRQWAAGTIVALVVMIPILHYGLELGAGLPLA